MNYEHLSTYSAVECFLIMSQFLGVQASEEDLKQIAANSSFNESIPFMLEAAKYYQLKGKYVVLPMKDLVKKAGSMVPFIAQDREGSYFIIARLQEEEALLLYPGESSPHLLSLEKLKEKWDGSAILLTKKGSLRGSDSLFSFKWFIPTVLRFKTAFIQVLLGIFVIQILGISTPIMVQVIIDKVLSHHSLSTLTVIAIGIGLVYIFELILSLAKNYLFTHTTNRIDVLLNARLFKHLFALPLRYFEARRAGETVARVQELHHIRQFLTGTPLSSLIDAFFILVYVAVLFFYSVPLTWLVLASIPCFALLSAIVTPLFKKSLDEQFQAGAETSSFLVESIQGVQTVKSFALESKFEQKWGDLQADYVKANYRTAMIASNSGAVGQFIQKAFDLLILVFGALAVIDGKFTIGQLVAFRMLSSHISGPVLRLVQLWQEYQQASLSVTRIGDIFNSPTELRPNALVELPTLEGKIVFDHVRFRYRSDASDVIKDMSFTIPAGSIVGVVGRSGSGKSTLSKLIQRLYIPEAGKISIDGLDLSLVNPEQLRRQIGIVLQENFMFNGTVRENISIHLPLATMDEVVAAAKTAGAHDFILGLPQGYDTVIGEKGLGLSGGQKQRVAIARAILGNPKILIFDEATSALDYESERIIQDNLKTICQGRTVLIIAHRLSTLAEAEKILVVDEGNVVSYDSHERLLEEDGLYAHLYRQQERVG
ncbi:Hemolysin exporter, ATPase component, putative [Streptococcus sanguinis SK36]|uniref:Hemolysin exporter, ATPase component, putative n=1 Tax=Streptococcus sanguinis (strain SK36) TaxID=388919 RepID=A3CMV7_STRSV|nr:type I secretion system permease/ATPase [Streptococcus sanguinis]ABN44512.1 Hemolysin exporter, ATPase component, putative [Streptococcus sanguinis SK36]MBZ2055824.1 type I secretion system permease/ATPase [Streptococcus sanguinis]